MKQKTQFIMSISLATITFLLGLFPVVVAAAGIGCPNGTIPNGERTPEVSEAWCELETNQALFHGPYRAWYPNGVTGTKVRYDHGKLDGKAVYRWSNGKKQTTGQYKKGIREGVWLFWEKSGAVAGRAVYKNGTVISGQVPDWAVESGVSQEARHTP